MIHGMGLLQVLIALGCIGPSSTPQQQAAKIRAVTEDLQACVADFATWFHRHKLQRMQASPQHSASMP